MKTWIFASLLSTVSAVTTCDDLGQVYLDAACCSESINQGELNSYTLTADQCLQSIPDWSSGDGTYLTWTGDGLGWGEADSLPTSGCSEGDLLAYSSSGMTCGGTALPT